MKKIVILICFFLCIGTQMKAQNTDAIKEIQRLTLENDSLKKRIEFVENRYKDILANCNNEKNRLESENKDLQRKNTQLQKEVDNNKNIRTERDNLKQENETLLKRLEIEKQEQFEAGKKSVINRIEQTYGDEFDMLIRSTSLQTIQRDLPFVEDTVIEKKMQDLQLYFEVQQVLCEKYDEQKVQAALSQIKSLPQTKTVKALGESLDKYPFSFNALGETINKIIENDKNFIANDDFIKKEKMKVVMAELSDYFYNYDFDFAEYPYLSSIVMEIMNRKQKDVNADLSDMLKKFQ